MLKEKVRKTIKDNALINKGDSIVIGLSGGADSVCLTHILYSLQEELNISLVAVHLNHNIRGDEAQRDMLFARDFAKSLGIRFIKGSARVCDYAREKGISEEMAGRELRYSFFNDVKTALDCQRIATAHNRNDNAETIAMNFMRGTSLTGLSGIPYMRDDIIRPILDVTRKEVEEYCEKNNLSYVTDSTNEWDAYTRNKIRHRLIPLIETEFNPNFINTVSANADLIKCESDYINESVRQEYKRLVNENCVKVSELLKRHKAIQRRIIRQMMSNIMDMQGVQAYFTDSIIELAKKNKSGSMINLPNGKRARIEYGYLKIDSNIEVNSYEYDIPLNKAVFIKEAGITVLAEETDKKCDGVQCFSGCGIDNIKVRNRRNGDYFYPAGMGGKKKLKDFFIDSKIPRDKRDIIPLITFDGEIGYVTDLRRDERFKFRDKGIKITILK